MERRLAYTLQCLPIVALALWVSVWSGRPAVGIAAIGGAVSVGFGSLQRFTRFRPAPMILAAFAMGLSAWVGAMLARSSLLNTAIILGIWGYALAAAAVINTGLWWVCLQAMIGLLVSFAYPADAYEATMRIVLVLIGGLAQAVFIIAIWRVRGLGLICELGSEHPTFPSRKTVMHRLSPRGQVGQRVCWVAIALSLAGVGAIAIRLPNAYWVPMTAAIVVKLDLRSTLWRGLARVGGTVGGAGIVTLIIALARPTPTWLAVLTFVAVCAAYLTQKRNYTFFAAAMTGYVVLVLALAGLPGISVAEHRFIATLIGAAIALLPHLAPTVQHEAAVPDTARVT